MSGVGEMLIRGSEKVIAHYRRPLAGIDREHEFYHARIEREQRLLEQLRAGMPRSSAA